MEATNSASFLRLVASITKRGEQPQDVPGASLTSGYILLEDEDGCEMLDSLIQEARGILQSE